MGLSATTTDLFEQVVAISIPKYISYATIKTPKKDLIKALPEAAVLTNAFNTKAKLDWQELRRTHNRNIERGERMRLLSACRSLKRMKFDSLDDYMLMMHGDAFVEALLSVASFGERVQRARALHQADEVWCIEMPFLITRTRWDLLCKRIKKLVRAIESKITSDGVALYDKSLTVTLQKVALIF